MTPRTDDLRPTDDDVFDALGLAPLGHNRPPEDDIDEKLRKALADAERYVANANRWATERETIADEEQAGAAQLQVEQLRSVEKELEALRTQQILPLDTAIDIIRIGYKRPLALVDLSLKTLLGKLDVWLKAKRDREAAAAAARKSEAEEASRDALEALAKAAQERTMEARLASVEAVERALALNRAADRPPAPVKVKGDYGTRAMSLHSHWKARVIDEQAALRHFAKNADVRAAALKAITKIGTDAAKACKGEDAPPPGLEFWNDEKPQ